MISRTMVKLNFSLSKRIIVISWLLTVGLVCLELSDLFAVIDFSNMFFIGVLIPLFMLVGFYLFSIEFPVVNKNIVVIGLDLNLITRKLNLFSIIFFALVVGEFLLEGYVPIISMFQGQAISQFDFGVASLHGFLMSFGSMLFTGWFFVFHIKKDKKALFFMSLILIFFVLVVTRKMIAVSLIQAFLVAFLLRGNNKFILKTMVVFLVFVIVFGWIGDIRTGRELFLSLSHFKSEYPEWLPTGFAWVYIYITTPLVNLVNAFQISQDPTFDFSFLGGIFPSVVRGYLFELNNDPFGNYWQISGAFNVGTGFMPLYLSFGLLGVFFFSFGVGFMFAFIKYKLNNFTWFLIYIVVFQCSVLLIFNNNFFNLNTVSQVVFSFLFYRVYFSKSRSGFER